MVYMPNTFNTINSPQTNILVDGQFCQQTPFFASHSKSLLVHSRKRTLRRKRTRVLFKVEIGFFPSVYAVSLERA